MQFPSSRSKSPERSYVSEKFSLYQVQDEYVFPVGIVEDIDENIIKQLDFDGLINLLTVNRTPQLRKKGVYSFANDYQ